MSAGVIDCQISYDVPFLFLPMHAGMLGSLNMISEYRKVMDRISIYLEVSTLNLAYVGLYKPEMN